MLPIHRNPTDKNDQALAPYNFVELPNLILEGDSPVPRDRYHAKDQESGEKARLTGHILCQLTTETPLYTRAALNKEEYDLRRRKSDRRQKGLLDDKPDFFYVDETTRQPVIPGSTLRGMLRTLAEIVGYAKVDAVSDAQLVYRSVDTTSHGLNYRERLVQYNGRYKNDEGKNCRYYTPLMRAGYLRCNNQNEWRIQPAQLINGTSFARVSHTLLENLDSSSSDQVPNCKNATYIYFQAGNYEYQDVRGGSLRIKMSKIEHASFTPTNGYFRGALARSGDIDKKASEAVIFPENEDKNVAISVTDEMVDTYRAQISQEQEKLLGPEGVLNDGQPVFYLIEEGKLIFFGHTMMMRLPYIHTPKNFVPKKLHNNEQTDIVEALFGYVAQKKPETRKIAHAGRIFVGDAKLCEGQMEEKLWLEKEPIVPKILGTPKPTTFQHYLVQRNPDPIQINQKPKKVLDDYKVVPEHDSVIRGHKRYWHKGIVQASELKEISDNIKAPEEDTQHTQIKPVAPGVTFTFKIHFENLTKVELGLLLWVLTLPGDAQTEYRHKLGMGKPLGMGAVHLQPQLVLSNREARYRTLFDEQGWATAERDESDITTYINAFERNVLDDLTHVERADQTIFVQIPRIQTLLTLLAWPGPTKRQTRYMKIPDGKGQKNEYRDRPVLPTPRDNKRQGNLDKWQDLSKRMEETQVSITHITASASNISEETRNTLVTDIEAVLDKKDSVTKTPPKKVNEVSTVTSKDELKPSMTVKGTVLRVEESRVVIEILGEEATLQKVEIQPAVRDRYDMEERFPVGKIIRSQVKRINKRGRIQLTQTN